MFDSELKFCANYVHRCDYKGKTHSHSCYELVYYVHGNGLVTIDGVKHIFTPHSFCLTEPNSFHSEEGASGTEVLYIGFLKEDRNFRLPSGVYDDNCFEILELLKRIYFEMQGKPLFHPRMMNLYTEMIAITVFRRFEKPAAKGEDDMDYVVNFIKLNCMNNLNVKELAKSASYSYDYFRHKFADKMHMTAKEYIMQERFRYAKDLLINYRYSIKEVAYMAGYNSPSHFSAVFKKETGMMPNEFKKQSESELRSE